MAEIKKFICVCGSGVGSSMMVQMNVEKVMKELGKKGITVEHAKIEGLEPEENTVYVIAKELAPQFEKFPRRVELDQIMSMKELRPKIEKVFEQTEDQFVIG
ncbi:PTS sugar transporter subunit IIB [Catenisphaera adipataccumulans]|jgi:PTS system ascorbate-specific IIB component|uniref:PTS system ascorbate-specific IIB component n=1 Tax=Catenisphaera adipataccumulans TaxID=700500 RepID=A0A7W8CVT2_9FIRM|nr:PTS sugar transporter subunit IIB [Catenisphaera adipataccumulans]MBB5182503.1 PTS system ascorbate-specific IIB component [Catenisphaera adipataccumulans]